MGVSARLDLIVSGGTICTEAGTFQGDLGIVDGRFVAIAERLEDAAAFVDANGLLVMPGGVDAHCHMDQPDYGGAACADDFRSGTISAACGGTTTVIPFAMGATADALGETVENYRARAEAAAIIDYAIHPVIQAVHPPLIAQTLPALAAEGLSSWKIFTTYDGFRLDDAAIFAVFAAAARLGIMVMVHAESDAIVAHRTEELLAQGRTALRYHGEARPVAAECEAIHRIGRFAEATGATVMIVHVSSADGLAEVERARARGVAIHAETCPHYLVLTTSDLDGPLEEAARFLCSPPLRAVADQECLWAAMERGTIQVCASDHSPSRLDGPAGKLRHGSTSSFAQIANGLPGIELRLPLLFSEGYRQGRISLPQFVALSATEPARLHGIGRQKGKIAIGADADLVLFDPDREVTVTHTLLHDDTGFTPYEGRKLKGWPVKSISRGEVVVDAGEVLAATGRGRFVPADFGGAR